ncbi:hypothetical protein KAFR_0G01350 [Kazachstania africana CBS 2517]|uniref:NADP-dependent oxidoreductase domain-containing protein n=1 Tax=Kazachstania africana (strain ATCC 22294 / BCRC 22015 / CBS 2517 / CECT 1963 / NBRC 1671 / NRRL Y-8276) TaxID=1071382 RepID=H2AXR9_KAZAF|nr:hypothetical protein KAFR_0G01350 [Kazachstania africana CBS 2517]CCF59169.1 hypothetical protein KAFR_0G01350 [Kazachstania africana CBS 2517]
MLHPKSTEIYFKLNNGTTIPALGFGTYAPRERIPETKQAVKAAIKAGYRHIDTAWVYESEPYVGEAIKEMIEEGEVSRSDLFVTTKVWPVYWDNVEKSLNESLEALGLDYVDLLLQHWPLCFPRVEDEKNGVNGLVAYPEDDEGKPLLNEKGDFLETYRQIEKIYLNPDDHRVRAIGVSNYAIEYLEALFKECKVKPVVNQVEIHPHLPQLELNKFCHNHGILLTAYSPLGSDGAPNLKIPLVHQLAEKYDMSLNDILISYHIRKGNTVIPRSLNPVRIASTIEFAPFTQEELKQLDNVGIEEPARFVDAAFAQQIPGFGKSKK